MEEGIIIKTKNERVMNVRRLVIELLLARNPQSDVITDLAKKLDVVPYLSLIKKYLRSHCGHGDI